MTTDKKLKEICIQICTGTTCYVMGASDLLTIEDCIMETKNFPVRISGSTCLGLCKDSRLKPPFVRICGKVIAMATVEKILEAVTAEDEGTYYAYDE